jgi:hypothetical protein
VGVQGVEQLVVGEVVFDLSGGITHQSILSRRLTPISASLSSTANSS